MPPKSPPNPADNSDVPYGADPRRGRGPLVFWIVLYVLWLGVLVWMALFTIQRWPR